jgi:predicted metal-dependent HD superfamily phosphohydrolase
LLNYTDDKNVIVKLWNEIERKYAEKNRHYHTLQHLNNLLLELTPIQKEIENWETILFTLYYHDIIYTPQKFDNEEKSAALAEKRMKQLAIPNKVIEDCKLQILATKTHIKSANNDTNYFTDADLSILGQPWEIYETYLKNVRKEYAIYEDSIYNPGRKKVLLNFLQMDCIFKTDFFHNKYEIQAKQNLQNEIDLL